MKAKTIDQFLAALPDRQRVVLERLRKAIRAAAPEAEECISYQLAAFRQNGMLVAFGATASHCAFYLMSGSTVEAHRDELKDYDTSKGTIRFQADKPLPVALVRKLVKARIAENEDRGGGPKKRGSRPTPATAERGARPAPADSREDPEVTAFVRGLKHRRKPEIESVRRIILMASPEISEGIKWNSPSFRTTDWFATLNLRQDRVWLILHTGAKAKETATRGLKIADPGGLLKWLAKDRCLVTFDDAKDVQKKGAALQEIVQQWIGEV